MYFEKRIRYVWLTNTLEVVLSPDPRPMVVAECRIYVAMIVVDSRRHFAKRFRGVSDSEYSTLDGVQFL